MDEPPREDSPYHHRPNPRHSQPLPPAGGPGAREPEGRTRWPNLRGGSRNRLVIATTLGLAAVVGIPLALIASDDGERSGTLELVHHEVPLSPAADTYVVREDPGANHGAAGKLTAAGWDDWHSETYISFTVPQGVDDVAGARVELTFNRLDNQPRALELRSLPSAGWTEGTTTWRNRPRAGPVVATAPITPGTTRRVSLDVGSVVRGPGTYSFAITNGAGRSAISLNSKESGQGPSLILRGRTRGADSARPEHHLGTRGRPPISEPAPPRRSLPSFTPGLPPSTLCGASFNTEKGETFQQALKRQEGYYGRLGAVRLFYGGLPPRWPGRITDGRTQIISFKLNPREVLDGRHDDYLRQWFVSAPANQDIYWVYYHEPEDNIAKGEFSADDYRAAWRHLRELSDAADNPRLKATLVLMGWDLDPRAKRNWRDYYPGNDVVQVMGWDIYNDPPGKNAYQPPATMFGQAISISRAEGLPFGIAETGSFLMPGDNGERRAAWLRDVTTYLAREGALWVAYFDHDWPTGDYRLLDDPSRRAWRDFC